MKTLLRIGIVLLGIAIFASASLFIYGVLTDNWRLQLHIIGCLGLVACFAGAMIFLWLLWRKVE